VVEAYNLLRAHSCLFRLTGFLAGQARVSAQVCADDGKGAEAHDQRGPKLGMDRAITRRDFVSGVAVATGALAAGMPAFAKAPPLMMGAQTDTNPYPRARTGLRGRMTARSRQRMPCAMGRSSWRRRRTAARSMIS